MKSICILLCLLILIVPSSLLSQDNPSADPPSEKAASIKRERNLSIIGWTLLVSGFAALVAGIARKTDQNSQPLAERDQSYRDYLVAGGMSAGVGAALLLAASIESKNSARIDTTSSLSSR